jgi:diguanylate cyclase (GGDEF)-like protein
MMDLDGFKLFNDSYGHLGGDEALGQVASYLVLALRASDIIARFGGDEFLVILPGTDAGGALEVCQHLQSGLAEQRYRVQDAEVVHLRVSFGIASYPTHGRRANELIAAADVSLYRSKRQGGDQITSPTVEREPVVA